MKVSNFIKIDKVLINWFRTRFKCFLNGSSSGFLRCQFRTCFSVGSDPDLINLIPDPQLCPYRTLMNEQCTYRMSKSYTGQGIGKKREHLLCFLLLLQMLQSNFIFQESGFYPRGQFLGKNSAKSFFFWLCVGHQMRDVVN